ncbi:MAG: LacI family DNA-binding transcriptional regulator [Methylocystaceae bacterium]|nr:LacI family DNA-binding transcriptional regulator [Methylocystaceae bacterium]
MPSKRKTTILEVAEFAKTSPATVDRVLNNRGGVSEKLETRVIQAAKKLMLDRNFNNLDKPLLRFSILMNRPDRDIYARVQKAILDYQELYASIQFVCNFHYFSSQKPEDIVGRIESIERGFDGAIIVAYDHPSINDALQRLSARIPIVTLLSDIPYSNRIHFAGSGNRVAGKMAGGLMGKLVKQEEGKVLIISRLQHYTAHGDREIGFRQVISERYPRLSANNVVECNHGDKRDLNLIREAIGKTDQLVGLYNISSWNINLVTLLHEYGYLNNAIVISHGVNRRSREMLQAEYLDVVVEYCPESYATMAVDALLHHYERKETFVHDYRHRLEVFTPEYLPPIQE